jgi:hypothetical protein
MNWYAAHLIMYFKRKRGRQKRFLVWENIVLVKAKSFEDAYEKAERIGRDDEAANDDHTTIGGHPSRMIFAGVRKATLCVDPEDRPSDGTEVSYNTLGVHSEAAIKKLADGDAVMVEMLDPFPDDEPVVPVSENGAHRPRKLARRHK